MLSYIYNYFNKITDNAQVLRQFMFIFMNWLVLNLKIRKKDVKASDKAYLAYVRKKENLKKFINFFSFYFYMDFILIFFLKKFYKKDASVNNFNFKHKNANSGYVFNSSANFYSFKQTLLSGIFSA